MEGANAEVLVHGFRDGFFPYVGGEIKDVFEELKGRLEPDVIFTHARHDLHQDHRLVCELTWNTWRDHLILEYEIPKYDGDLGTPNLFVPVSQELAREKVRLLHEAFASQSSKHWFEDELFLGPDAHPRDGGTRPQRLRGGVHVPQVRARDLVIFHGTQIEGVVVVEAERLEDERGFFARTWDVGEFAEQGLNPRLTQCSISYNRARGTLRGMHFQARPTKRRSSFAAPPAHCSTWPWIYGRARRRSESGSASSYRPRTVEPCTFPRAARTAF